MAAQEPQGSAEALAPPPLDGSFANAVVRAQDGAFVDGQHRVGNNTESDERRHAIVNRGLTAFLSAHDGRATVEFDAAHMPTILTDFETRPSPEKAEVVACQFVADNRELLLAAEDPQNLEYEGTLSSSTGTNVRLRQTHLGVPVFDSSVVVQVDREGRVRFVNGAYRPGINISTEPRISAGDALCAASAPAGAEAQLTILADVGSRPMLAWHVTSNDGAAEHVLVSDSDGTVLRRYSTVSELNRGNVFPTNPDESPLTNVTLTAVTTPGTLVGPFASVGSFTQECFTAASITPSSVDQSAIADANGDFSFGPSDPRTALVQVYYQVHRAHEFFSGLGFHGLDFPLHAVVNIPSVDAGSGRCAPFQNAQFVPFGPGFMRFGFPQSDLNYAFASDVVFHEYTHAVVYHSARFAGFGEPKALNEAFADYFAFQLTGDPAWGAYIVRHNRLFPPSAVRDMSSPESQALHYPEDLNGEEHDDSRIFSAALYLITQDVGVASAKQVVFDALLSLNSSATFSTAAAAVVNSARATYGTADPRVAQVQQRFASRGLPYPVTLVQLNTPQTVSGSASGSIAANGVGVDGSGTPTQYVFVVADGASQFDLAITSSANLDLWIRFARPVSATATTVTLADNVLRASGGGTHAGQLDHTPASKPRLQAGLYYMLVQNLGSSGATFDLTAAESVVTSLPNLVPIGTGVGGTGSVPPRTRDYTQFFVDLPAGTDAFAWSVSSSIPNQPFLVLGRLGLPVVATADTGVPSFDFYAVTSSGQATVVLSRRSVPAVVQGRYFLDVVNLGDARLDYGIGVATVTGTAVAALETALQPGRSLIDVAPASVASEPGAVSDTQYAIAVPPGAASLTVYFVTSTNTAHLDMYVKRASRIATDAIGFPDASFISTGGGSIKSVTVDATTDPPLQAGKYYVAVANYEERDQAFGLIAEVRTAPASGGGGSGGGGGCGLIARDARPSSALPIAALLATLLAARARRRPLAARRLRAAAAGVAGVAALAICSGCGPTFIRTGPERPPLTPGAAVKLCLSGERPAFTEIGVLDFEFITTYTGSALQEAAEAAVEEARKYGANCVVLIDTQAVSGFNQMGTQYQSTESTHYRFAIGVLSASAATAGPSPPAASASRSGEARFCTGCGVRLLASDTFCAGCGRRQE